MNPQPTPRRSPPALHVLAFLAYLALTLFYMRPAAQVLGTHLAPDSGDPLFNMVVLKWGIHEMRTGMHGFWNLPFFFPARDVTTYSDHLLGPAAFATLFTAFVPNPLAAYNLLFLGSFVLCGFNTWYVLRRCGTGIAAAFLGGCMFAFLPFRWDQMSHLQVLLMHWIPVTLWSWDRLLAGPAWRRAAVFFVFYTLHVTGGTYLGYMIHVPMLVLLLYRAPALWQGDHLKPALKILLPTGLAAALVLAGVYVPYLRAAGHQARTPLEIQVFGASLVSYVTPTASNLYGALAEGWRRPENSLFPGFLLTLLAFLAARRGWKRLRTPPARPLSLLRRIVLLLLAGLTAVAWVIGELRVWEIADVLRAPAIPGLSAHRLGVVALAAGVLALCLRRLWGGNWPLRLKDLDPWERGLAVSGLLCFLLTFPLVYLPLMRIIPGLSGMRVPARFSAFVFFPLVYFAARELDRWRLHRLAVGLVTALLLLEVMPTPVNWEPLEGEAQFPAVDHWLARQHGVAAILELPIEDNSADIVAMYHATLHWKPLVNGYSGYIPTHYADLQRNCCYPLPDPEQLQRLRNWGVTHVMLRKDILNTRWKRRRAWRWATEPGISIEYEDKKERVYRIAPIER
jgi:hypothetical protein